MSCEQLRTIANNYEQLCWAQFNYKGCKENFIQCFIKMRAKQKKFEFEL